MPILQIECRRPFAKSLRRKSSIILMQPGQPYTASGEFQLVNGATVTPTGIVGTADFTPTASTGSVTVTFAVPAILDAKLLGGTLVAFENLTQSGSTVAIHTDSRACASLPSTTSR